MRNVIALLLVALLLSAAVANAQEMVVAPGDPVVFGVSVGLSGEGIAPLGEDIKRGIEIAQSETPTITINGVEFAIELDVQDSQCNAEGGVAVATRFASDPSIVGVIGPMCSSACFPAAPIYDAAGYSSISPSCSAAILSESDFTSFNRTYSSDNNQGTNTAHYVLNEMGITRVATIHDGSPYAEGLVDVFTGVFTELGGEIVAADAVTVGDTQFQSLLSEIAESEPELIYFPGFPAEAARLMQQRADVGLEDDIFFGADGWKGPEVIELAGGSGRRRPSPPRLIPVSANEEQEAAYNAFLAAYEETYGETPLAYPSTSTATTPTTCSTPPWKRRAASMTKATSSSTAPPSPSSCAATAPSMASPAPSNATAAANASSPPPASSRSSMASSNRSAPPAATRTLAN